jgi:molybdopterin converting factor small subunit
MVIVLVILCIIIVVLLFAAVIATCSYMEAQIEINDLKTIVKSMEMDAKQHKDQRTELEDLKGVLVYRNEQIEKLQNIINKNEQALVDW